MSKSPAMPLFVGSYKQDTGHLTLEEHGAYLLLLMAMWSRDGTIPDNDTDTARVLHISRRKWLQLKPRLMPFLESYGPENSKILTQKRLQKEWNSCAEYRAAQREKSSRGGDATRQKYQGIRQARGLLSGLGPEHGPKASPKARPETGPADSPPFPIKNISSTSEPNSPAPAREPADAAAPDGAAPAPSEKGAERKTRASGCSLPFAHTLNDGLQPIGDIPHRLLTPSLTGKGRMPPPRFKRSDYDRRH